MNSTNLAIIATATLLGRSSVPHCAAMCGAAPAFHLGRLLSYATAGAIAAASIGVIADWARSLHGLLALWVLLQAAMLCAGAFTLLTGRTPALNGLGGWAPKPDRHNGEQPIRWGRVRAGMAGGLWVAWPCGALQGVLVVAALTSGPVGGAMAMAAFALASSGGLWLTPWLMGRAAGAPFRLHATRLAGLLLMLVSGWALWRSPAARIAARC